MSVWAGWQCPTRGQLFRHAQMPSVFPYEGQNSSPSHLLSGLSEGLRRESHLCSASSVKHKGRCWYGRRLHRVCGWQLRTLNMAMKLKSKQVTKHRVHTNSSLQLLPWAGFEPGVGDSTPHHPAYELSTPKLSSMLGIFINIWNWSCITGKMPTSEMVQHVEHFNIKCWSSCKLWGFHPVENKGLTEEGVKLGCSFELEL